jgi:hypothetical protein
MNKWKNKHTKKNWAIKKEEIRDERGEKVWMPREECESAK